MRASSIPLERNRTQIVSLIKHASRGIALAGISIFLLISIVGLKAYKTELGYELTKSINTYSKISIENKKLRSLTLKLKSHERIESLARKNSMKFPSQRDLIRINNE
jgi:cell division protein FtsL